MTTARTFKFRGENGWVNTGLSIETGQQLAITPTGKKLDNSSGYYEKQVKATGIVNTGIILQDDDQYVIEAKGQWSPNEAQGTPTATQVTTYNASQLNSGWQIEAGSYSGGKIVYENMTSGPHAGYRKIYIAYEPSSPLRGVQEIAFTYSAHNIRVSNILCVEVHYVEYDADGLNTLSKEMHSTTEGDDLVYSAEFPPDGRQITKIIVDYSLDYESYFQSTGNLSQVQITSAGRTPITVSPSYGPEGDGSTTAPSGFLLPGVPAYALIGRVGEDGDWFLVGDTYSDTATMPTSQTKSLYLAINDNQGQMANNTGFLTINTRVGSAVSGCGSPILPTEPNDTLVARVDAMGTPFAIGDRYAQVWSGSPGTIEVALNRCANGEFSVNVAVDAVAVTPDTNQSGGNNNGGICLTNSQRTTANPIQLNNAAKLVSETDLVVHTPAGQLSFARFFNQANLEDSHYDFMGKGWSHSHRFLFEVEGFSPDRIVRIYLPSGVVLTIPENGNSGNPAFDIAEGMTSRLVETASNQFELINADGSIFFFEPSQALASTAINLVKRIWPSGEVWTYTYDEHDLLEEVSDAYGRYLMFAYYGSSPDAYKENLLWRVIDSANRTVMLDYIQERIAGSVPMGAGALLRSVVDPMENTWTYDYYGQLFDEDDTDLLNVLVERRSPEVTVGTKDGIIALEQLAYSVNGNGKVTQITQERGNAQIVNQLAFERDGSDELLATQENLAGLLKTHQFVGGLYVGTSDSEGNTPLQLAGKGVNNAINYRPVVQLDAQGHQTNLEWENNGKRLTQITDAADHSTRFAYNDDDTLNMSTDAAERKTTYVYDPPLRQPTLILVSETDDQIAINGSMDDESGWTSVGTPANNERSSTVVKHGSYSRYIKTDETNEGVESASWGMLAQRTYTITAQVYLVAAKAVTLGISGLSSLDVDSTTLTGAWQTLQIRYTAAPGDVGTHSLKFIAAESGAEFYVDRVSIQVDHEIAIQGNMEDLSDWSAVGSPTREVIPQADKGTYLRQVVADAVNEGVEIPTLNLVNNGEYRVRARVYVAEGAVKIQLPGITFDSNPTPIDTTTVTGQWQTLDATYTHSGSTVSKSVQVIASTLDGISNQATVFVDYITITGDADVRVDGSMAGSWSDISGSAPVVNTQVVGADTGMYHQRIQATTSAGIESVAWDLRQDKTYVLMARVYLVSGAMQMQVSGLSAFDVALSESGAWQTLRAVYTHSSATQTGRQLEFVATQTGTEFYVDTVHLVEVEDLLSWQEYIYDSRGRTLSKTQMDCSNAAPAQQTLRSYWPSGDGEGLLQSVIQKDMDGSEDTSITYTYDSVGRVIKTQKSSLFGNCTFSYTVYDAMGRVVATACGRESVTIPTTVQEARELYDASDPSKFTITTHAYDELGRRYMTTTNDGDDNGEISPNKQTSLTAYDTLGRVIRTISNYNSSTSNVADPFIAPHANIEHGPEDNENLVTDTIYNAQGQVAQQVDVSGNVTTFVYDPLGRMVRTVQNYVAQGNSDPADWYWNGTNWQYGMADATAIDHGAGDQNIITSQAYDANGNLVKSVDTLGRVTYTIYDVLNRPTAVIRNAKDEASIDLNSGDTAYTVANDPRQVVYDPDDEETEKYSFSEDPDRDQITLTEYDVLGRVLLTRQLIDTRGDNEDWRTTYNIYDALGRLIRVIRSYVEQGESDPADWWWNDVSGQWQYSSGDTTSIVQDSDALNNRVNDQNLISETVYDDQGRVQHTSDVNQSLNHFVYDGLNRQVKTITNYMEQPTDPSQWTWQNDQWEYSTSNEVNFGTENDQNVISETVYDADGRVQETRDVLGRVTYNVYDQDGRLIRRISNFVAQATTPDEWEWREVSSVYAWRLSAVNDTLVERRSDPINHPATHDQNIISDTVYDEAGRVLETIDVRNNFTRFLYDKLGRRVMSVSNYVAQANPPEEWEWDSNDTRWEDGSGNAIARGTDNDENLISFTRYDLAGRVDFTRNAVGLVSKNVYDKAGRRVRTIQNYVTQGASDPADWSWNASARTWQYSAGNAVSHGADFDQNIISDTVYNNGGQMVSTRDARGTLTAFTYDNAGRRLTVTRAEGSDLATTSYTCYDKAGRVLRSIANYLEKEEHDLDAMDSNGDWVYVPTRHGSHNDRNRVTQFVYDNSDRRVQVIDPLDNITETSYFLDGQVDTMTHKDVAVNGTPTDVVTQYGYDKLRRRLVVVQNYVDNGEDPENWVWNEEATPDPKWQKSDETTDIDHNDPAYDQNIIVRVARDIAGRMVSLRDPRGNQTTYSYDQLNRRLTLTNPLSHVWKSTYSDLSDGLTRTTLTYPGLSSGGSYAVAREFDPLGRLIKIDYGDLDKTDPGFTPDVDFAYDAAGNRSRMTEYEDDEQTVGRETLFSYDAARRLTQVDFDTDGDTVVEESVAYEYDQGGLKTKMTLPGILEVTYVYDSRGRLVSLTDWDDQPTSFFYDKADRHVGTVRANGLTSDYLHDRVGRLMRVRHRAGQNLRAFFEYQVDARGNRIGAVEKQVTTADGTLYGKDAGIVSYDAGTWTDDGSFKKSTQFSARMSIDWTGDEARMTIGTGPDHGIFDVYIGGSFWQSFDGYAVSSGERVIHIPVDGAMEIRNRADHSRQSSGYVIRFKSLQLVNITPIDRDIAYTYDALSRLIEADYDSGTTVYDYGYDLAGNLVDMDGTGRTYNAANQMTNDGSNTLTYDANGNLTGDGINSYTWDRANRMLTAPGSTSYAYDGLGNRVQQTVSSMVTDYLLDLQSGLTKVLRQDDGSNTDHFIHGPRGLHAQYDGTNWQYIAQDGLGSVRSIIDSNLGVDGVQSYDPYGVPDASYGAGFGFTGEQTDGNGQVYLRARYYNPSIGVFPSLDPFEGMMDRPMSLNGYSWVEGNTPNMVDPNGRQIVEDIPCWQKPEGRLCPPGYYSMPHAYTAQCMKDDETDWYFPDIAWHYYWEERGCKHPYLFIPIPGLDGYVEGANAGFTVSGENVQMGIEVVYNLKTFQRITWFYTNDLSNDLVVSDTNAFYGSLAGGSAAPYVGHVTGFKSLANNEIPPNSSGHYNQYRNQYSGQFEYRTADVGTPIVKLGFGFLYFSSPEGSPEPVWGITGFVTAGGGLQPPVTGGYGRLWYTEIQNTNKTYIQSNCKVNTDKLVNDIIVGEGSPLQLALIPLLFMVGPARAIAATQAAINADRHNFFAEANSCACGS